MLWTRSLAVPSVSVLTGAGSFDFGKRAREDECFYISERGIWGFLLRGRLWVRVGQKPCRRGGFEENADWGEERQWATKKEGGVLTGEAAKGHFVLNEQREFNSHFKCFLSPQVTVTRGLAWELWLKAESQYCGSPAHKPGWNARWGSAGGHPNAWKAFTPQILRIINSPSLYQPNGICILFF